jgi:hypothetical protein
MRIFQIPNTLGQFTRKSVSEKFKPSQNFYIYFRRMYEYLAWRHVLREDISVCISLPTNRKKKYFAQLR